MRAALAAFFRAFPDKGGPLGCLTVRQHLPLWAPAYTEPMATIDAPLAGTLAQGEASLELAKSWRKLTRAATVVAVLTAPALFVWFTQRNDWDWWVALLATLAIVIVFRGFADLLFRRLIPWPSLFGLESKSLRQEDVVGGRRDRE